MRGLLTDEQITHVVSEQVRPLTPGFACESVLRWRGGALRNTEDRVVLAAAHEEQLVLVTYDQRTILPLLSELGAAGEHHSGVVFVDQHSIRPSDIGGMVRALSKLIGDHGAESWSDRVQFLSSAAPQER